MKFTMSIYVSLRTNCLNAARTCDIEMASDHINAVFSNSMKCVVLEAATAHESLVEMQNLMIRGVCTLCSLQTLGLVNLLPAASIELQLR